MKGMEADALHYHVTKNTTNLYGQCITNQIFLYAFQEYNGYVQILRGF